MKKEIERILYKNYEPVRGLGADEIDIAIDQILELFAQEKEKLLKRIEKLGEYEIGRIIIARDDWKKLKEAIKKEL